MAGSCKEKYTTQRLIEGCSRRRSIAAWAICTAVVLGWLAEPVSGAFHLLGMVGGFSPASAYAARGHSSEEGDRGKDAGLKDATEGRRRSRSRSSSKPARSEKKKSRSSAGEPVLVSRVGRGGAGDQPSGLPSISADGRLVAFESFATNLVDDDDNRVSDIFLRDMGRERIRLVSRGLSRHSANAQSLFPRIAAQGNTVVFTSWADDLVTGDTNGVPDIFSFDVASSRITRVSVGADGEQANGPSSLAAVSGDGRLVVFVSDATNLVADDSNDKTDVFLHDRRKGTTLRLSRGVRDTQANGASGAPTISADGSTVAFSSSASNLIAQDRNRERDVFIYEVGTGKIHRASEKTSTQHASGASDFPSLSADGERVAFVSWAPDLAPSARGRHQAVFVRDWRRSKPVAVNKGPDGQTLRASSFAPFLSGDGSRVAFYAISGSSTRRGYVDAEILIHDLKTRVAAGALDGAPDPANPVAGVQAVLSHDGLTMAYALAAKGGDGRAHGRSLGNVYVFTPATAGQAQDGSSDEAACGNAVVEKGEACDVGSRDWVAGELCRPDCTLVDCGDVDGDRRVDLNDALLVLRASEGRQECSPMVCDVNASGGSVGADDVQLILGELLGLPSERFCQAGRR